MGIAVRYDSILPEFPNNLRIWFDGEENEIWDSANPYFVGEQSPQFIMRLVIELESMSAEKEYLLAVAREHIGFYEVEKGLKAARAKAYAEEMNYLESKVG